MCPCDAEPHIKDWTDSRRGGCDCDLRFSGTCSEINSPRFVINFVLGDRPPESLAFQGGSDPVLIGSAHLPPQVTVVQMKVEADLKGKKVRKRCGRSQ